MELSFLVDALKSLLINYTSNNSQIDESLNDLFSSLESKNLNNEIENYAEFILLASSLFELKAKRMLPQEEEIEWMDEVEILKDKDLAFARLLQFKAFSEIGIALASKIKYNENEIKSFKYYQTKNLFPKPDIEYLIDKDKFINTGLWSKSRHPNYLGEVLLWFGIAVMSISSLSGYQYLTLISPVFSYVLIYYVSGVRLLEESAKKKWGHLDSYKEYIKNTPVLFFK